MSTKSKTYPKRPKYFAHRYCRLLTKTCAAQEIGHIAFVLCATVAHQEDSKRYRGAVTYYNEQLMPLIGVTRWHTLKNARAKAVEFGWLHYEGGNRGKRQPGRYWVTIPPGLEEVDDSPCDESDSTASVEWNATHSTPNVDRSVDQRVDRSVELSTLTRTLTHKKEPAGAGDGPPVGLLELIDGWNELPTGIVKQGNGARRDPPSKAALKGWARAHKDSEQREAFSEIPALLEAIKRAKFCHGQTWFSLPWLFGTNRNNEFNVVKLLNGGHDGNGKPVRQDSPARIR